MLQGQEKNQKRKITSNIIQLMSMKSIQGGRLGLLGYKTSVGYD